MTPLWIYLIHYQYSLYLLRCVLEILARPRTPTVRIFSPTFDVDCFGCRSDFVENKNFGCLYILLLSADVCTNFFMCGKPNLMPCAPGHDWHWLNQVNNVLIFQYSMFWKSSWAFRHFNTHFLGPCNVPQINLLSVMKMSLIEEPRWSVCKKFPWNEIM